MLETYGHLAALVLTQESGGSSSRQVNDNTEPYQVLALNKEIKQNIIAYPNPAETYEMIKY